MVHCDHSGDDQRQRAPAYSGDGLHALYKRVLGQIPRVGERVFLPELAEEVLPAADALEVVCEVAFEDEVDAAAWIGLLAVAMLGWCRCSVVHRANHTTVHRSLAGICGLARFAAKLATRDTPVQTVAKMLTRVSVSRSLGA